MKVKHLDIQGYRTVFVRKAGQIKARKIPVKSQKPIKPHPMFPIERPQDGRENQSEQHD